MPTSIPQVLSQQLCVVWFVLESASVQARLYVTGQNTHIFKCRGGRLTKPFPSICSVENMCKILSE